MLVRAGVEKRRRRGAVRQLEEALERRGWRRQVAERGFVSWWVGFKRERQRGSEIGRERKGRVLRERDRI